MKQFLIYCLSCKCFYQIDPSSFIEFVRELRVGCPQSMFKGTAAFCSASLQIICHNYPYMYFVLCCYYLAFIPYVLCIYMFHIFACFWIIIKSLCSHHSFLFICLFIYYLLIHSCVFVYLFRYFLLSLSFDLFQYVLFGVFFGFCFF